MQSVLNSLFLLGSFLSVVFSRHVQFFRKDYIYIAKFDAFYKLHWNLHGLSWNTAFLACDDEGAMFFYPKVKDEWTLVKNLTSEMAASPNITDIFVGLHDEFGLGEFITIDGSSTSTPLLVEEPDDITEISSNTSRAKCVLMNVDTGSYKVGSCINYDQPIPFICKKIDDESCPTIDPGYKYVKSSKKCYKVNTKPKMWDEAMQTCYMEGGILAVLENKEQAGAITDKLERALTYYVGIRKMFSLGAYYTVKGQRYEDVYQKDAGNSRSDYECGAIYFDNAVFTIKTDCGNRLPFICEMEVNV